MHVRLLWPSVLLCGLLGLSSCATLATGASTSGAGATNGATTGGATTDAGRDTAAISNNGGARAPGAAQAGGAANGFVQTITATPFNLVSLPRLIGHEYDGRDLVLGEVLERTISYTRQQMSYRSGDLTISGTLSIPNRPGRFPVLVLAHGYQHPSGYQVGDGLVREQAYFAGNGYVVLHTDYRNHGQSDDDRYGDVRRPLGYPEDVVNAVQAVKQAGLPFVDTKRVGIFGRSMGGGVALQAVVARPDLVDAAVLYAPVSSVAADNFDRWVRGEDDLEQRLVRRYGRPETDPDLWRHASARSFLDRVDVPVQVHHGTADDVCPIDWSEATVARLLALGKDADLFAYPGEDHFFDDAWPTLMRRTVDFFDANL